MAEILDPRVSGAPTVASPAGVPEPELLAGRRAFPVAQELFAGGPVADALTLNVGWHDTSIHPEAGSFALVRAGGGFDALIGEIVRVTLNERQVFAYVIESVPLPDEIDLSLVRRCFLSIGRLSLDPPPCEVVPVQ